MEVIVTIVKEYGVETTAETLEDAVKEAEEMLKDGTLEALPAISIDGYVSECLNCETKKCVYNHNGICRYALVKGDSPFITDDGCNSGIVR